MLPEAVAEAISRQDTQAEMAEIDARTARAGKQKRKSTWVIESPIVGRIEQNDAPRIMTELLDEASIEKNGLRHLADELKILRPASLYAFAEGKIYMGRETGKLLVTYLEKRTMEKEKAASAATETTQRSEDTDQEASPDIVPQEAKEVIDDMAAQKEAQLESAREALANEQKESAERLIHLEDTQAKLEEKTIEAADLRARLKTAEEQNAGLRTDLNDSKALHEEIKRQLDEMRPAVAELTENVQRLQNENDAMSATLRHETEGRLKALDTLCDLVREMLGSNA